MTHVIRLRRDRNIVFQSCLRSTNALVARKKEMALGLLFVAVMIAAFFGYRYHRRRTQIAAHHDFVHALKHYDAPVKKTAQYDPAKEIVEFNNDQEKWQRVAELFAQGYDKNSGAGLAPMFLAFQSEALINLKKLDEAINVLKKSVISMSNKDVASYYEIKLALMQLDSTNKSARDEGLERLKGLTREQGTIAYDQALFNLGNYYWINKQFDEAKSYWQQFIVKFGNDRSLAPLVETVRSRLDLMAI